MRYLVCCSLSDGLDSHSWSDYGDKFVGFTICKIPNRPYIHELTPKAILTLLHMESAYDLANLIVTHQIEQ